MPLGAGGPPGAGGALGAGGPPVANGPPGADWPPGVGGPPGAAVPLEGRVLVFKIIRQLSSKNAPVLQGYIVFLKHTSTL